MIDINSNLLFEIKKVIDSALLLSQVPQSQQKPQSQPKPQSSKYLTVLDELSYDRFKLFSYKTLQETGISDCHMITTQDIILTGQKIILFFVAPLLDNIRLIINFLNLLKTPTQLDCHIIFTSIHLPTNLTTQLDVIEKHIKNVYYHKIPLNISQYDDMVIILDNNYFDCMIDYFADTESTIEYLFNEFDVKNNFILSIGKSALSISNKLMSSLDTDPLLQTTSTILIDRDYDLISVMKLPLTCGGITNEIFNCGKEAKIKRNKNNITINLNGQVFNTIRYTSIKDGNNEIKLTLKNIATNIKTIEEKIKDGLHNLIDEDKKFIKTIEIKKRECANLITLLCYLIDTQNQLDYVTKIELEKSIVNSIKLHTNTIDKIIYVITKLDDLITGLRFLILYSQYSNGLSAYDFIKLDNNEIKFKYPEWTTILKYLRQQNIIKVNNFGSSLMNFLKINDKDINKCLLAKILCANTSDNIINIVKQYCNDFMYSVMMADSDKTVTSVSNVLPRVVIVIVGGITVDEISEIKKMTKKMNRDVLIITDACITANSYINKIMTKTNI